MHRYNKADVDRAVARFLTLIAQPLEVSHRRTARGAFYTVIFPAENGTVTQQVYGHETAFRIISAYCDGYETAVACLA